MFVRECSLTSARGSVGSVWRWGVPFLQQNTVKIHTLIHQDFPHSQVLRELANMRRKRAGKRPREEGRRESSVWHRHKWKLTVYFICFKCLTFLLSTLLSSFTSALYVNPCGMSWFCFFAYYRLRVQKHKNSNGLEQCSLLLWRIQVKGLN